MDAGAHLWSIIYILYTRCLHIYVYMIFWLFLQNFYAILPLCLYDVYIYMSTRCLYDIHMMSTYIYIYMSTWCLHDIYVMSTYMIFTISTLCVHIYEYIAMSNIKMSFYVYMVIFSSHICVRAPFICACCCEFDDSWNLIYMWPNVNHFLGSMSRRTFSIRGAPANWSSVSSERYGTSNIIYTPSCRS